MYFQIASLFLAFFIAVPTVMAAPIGIEASLSPLNLTDVSGPAINITVPAVSEILHYSGGSATWYTQNGNAGACGSYHSDGDYISAIPSSKYSQDKCGKSVKVTNTKTGKSITVKVADECPTCSSNGIDLSKAAFSSLGSLNDGTFPVNWNIQ